MRELRRCIEKLGSITVEPVLFLTACSLYFSMTCISEYTYHRLAEQYGLANETSQSPCNESIHNKSNVELEKFVTSEAAKWNMYTTVPGTFISCFTAGIIGTWTDFVGRKPGLLISAFGLCVSMLISALTVWHSWPLYTLVIASVVFNLCGGMVLGLACCFAYLHDITPSHKLTLAISIGEVASGFGGTIANCVGGLLVDELGFLAAYLFLLSVAVLNFIYVAARFRSEGPTGKDVGNLLLLKPAAVLYGLVRTLFYENTFWRIAAYLCCLILYCFNILSVAYILVLYMLSPPFCLNTFQVGMVIGINNFLGFVIVPFTIIFKRPVEEYGILVFGIVLCCFGNVTIAFARNSIVVYLGLILCLLARIGFPVLRSHMSKLVSHSSQGALFSLIAISESLSILSTSLAYNGLYSVTVKTNFPGSVLFLPVFAGILCIAVFSFVFWQSRHILEGGYTTLPETDDEGIN